MSEQLEIYDLNSKLLGVQERAEFYTEIKAEFAKTGKISRKVKSIRLLLMNSNGRIYLQKRSRTKSENAGMYDKSVGGHVSVEESFELTVVRECAEELGFPATILKNEEFRKAIKGIDLSIIGVFREVDLLQNFQSVRVLENGSKIVQPFISSMYIGYYDGPIKFIDGECSGIEVFSLEELKTELKKNPAKFTEDLKFMIEKYESFLVPANKA